MSQKKRKNFLDLLLDEHLSWRVRININMKGAKNVSSGF